MNRNYQTQKFKQEVQGRIVIWIPCEIGLILSSTFRAVFDHIFSNLALTIFHAPSRRRRSRTVRNSFVRAKNDENIERAISFQLLNVRTWFKRWVPCGMPTRYAAFELMKSIAYRQSYTRSSIFPFPFTFHDAGESLEQSSTPTHAKKNGIAITLNKKHLKSQLVRNVQDDTVSLYVAQVPKTLRSI